VQFTGLQTKKLKCVGPGNEVQFSKKLKLWS